MQIKILIDGEDKRIVLTPETPADQVILKLLDAHTSAKIVSKIQPEYGYSGGSRIEKLNFMLDDTPIPAEEK